MPKVLICASTAVHIRNFHLPYLAFFKQQGYEVHVAVPENDSFDGADVVHVIPIQKRLISLKNLNASLRIRQILRSAPFEMVLVHTSLAAFVVRLGVLFSGRKKPPLINTVHGYFFWKGCSFIKRLMYYIPEFFLRGVTDCIITMNEEDASAAKHLVKKGGRVIKVHGMGVNAARFLPAEAEKKRLAREALNIPQDAYVLVYAAEFSKRKNHVELIAALDFVRKQVPEALLLLCGTGALENGLRDEIDRLNLVAHVRFMGWCPRMEAIYRACDMAVSTSISEGLPFNIAEAQLCALPVVASSIRGHTDLITDGVNGRLYEPGNAANLAATILSVIHASDGGKGLGTAARESALQYSQDVAYRENTEAYLYYLNKNKA